MNLNKNDQFDDSVSPNKKIKTNVNNKNSRTKRLKESYKNNTVTPVDNINNNENSEFQHDFYQINSSKYQLNNIESSISTETAN